MTQAAVSIDFASSKRFQDELQPRLASWLTKFTEVDGFAAWKNKEIKRSLFAGLLQQEEPGPPTDFNLPNHIRIEHGLVSGYYELQSSLLALRQTEFYFRRYPFGGKEVSREAHLRTCAELFLSRVYGFKGRWLGHVRRLDRRTKPKGLPISTWHQQFEDRFRNLLSARHEDQHEVKYSDLEMDAVGVGDLLALGEMQAEWLAVSRSSYRRICNGWVARVRTTADQLDPFLGLSAFLMLTRCEFLAAGNTKKSSKLNA